MATALTKREGKPFTCYISVRELADQLGVDRRYLAGVVDAMGIGREGRKGVPEGDVMRVVARVEQNKQRRRGRGGPAKS
jgi:hypothetical protein